MSDGTGIEGVGQIALTVPDVAQATEFYRDVLGLTYLFGASGLAFFGCGGVRLMLTAPEMAGPVGGTVVYYKVGDLGEAYTAMKSRGAVFEDEPHLVAKMPDHELWMVFLKDPGGNLVGLMSEVRAA